MKVRALAPFAALVNGEMRSYGRGAEFDLPDGTDWLTAGLVAPVSAPHLAQAEYATNSNVDAAERRSAPVSSIDGIGAVTAKLLAEGGIHTVDDLVDVDAPTLALLGRVSVAKAERWLQSAKGMG